MIQTAHLDLIPGTLALVRADLLRKSGDFALVGAGSEPGAIRYVRARPADVNGM